MDNEWDLHAVVRGFAATSGTPVAPSNNFDYLSPPSNNYDYFSPPSNNNYDYFSPPQPPINSSSSSPLPPIFDDENSFDFPGFTDDMNIDSLEGLHEIYQALCVDPEPTNPLTQVNEPQNIETVSMQQPIVGVPQMNVQNMQENVQLTNLMMISSPITNSQPIIRQRRRKNQQVKMVQQVTEEELSADSWAWRKYGQKRIKGSPYQRNYYRCSTSKGCAARKQVERSPNDPNIFIVTYSGDHTHARPSYRSSLAARRARNNNINNNNDNVSGSTFSPNTLIMEDETVAMPKDDQDTNNINYVMNNNILNDDFMYDNENIFNVGFHHQGNSSADNSFSSNALLQASPLWNYPPF